MTQPHAIYYWPGQTHFGYGVALRVGTEAAKLGASHVFLIADPDTVDAGLVKPIVRSIVDAGLTYSLYDAVMPNPTSESVDEAANAYRVENADILVAIGGGNALDTGKGVRMLVMNPHRSIADYSNLRGSNAVPPPAVYEMPPLLAIPTTAGSGAEVTPWGVITDYATQRTFEFGGPSVTPTVAFVDPELTLGLPPQTTAATGMDALTHLVEAFVSTMEAPALDPMILNGIELLGRSLPVAVASGSDRTAREEVMLAAMIGGVALSTRGLGACHSLTSPLSTMAQVEHSVAIAIMLPHVMAFNLPYALEGYAQVGQVLNPGLEGPLEALATSGVDRVSELLEQIGLPTRLRDVGVAEGQLGLLGTYAIRDLHWRTNPRRVLQQDFDELYRAAW
jgi:alcohol dehydrogenase class IV